MIGTKLGDLKWPWTA